MSIGQLIQNQVSEFQRQDLQARSSFFKSIILSKSKWYHLWIYRFCARYKFYWLMSKLIPATIVHKQDTGSDGVQLYGKIYWRLSSLRGKVGKISSEEIDMQIISLRSEWDRNYT